MPAVIRDPLREFAEAQEVTLREHDWDRGRLGWRTSDMDFLLHRLKEEVAELEQAIANPRDCYGIMREAVDVANFAMMIWDVARWIENA